MKAIELNTNFEPIVGVIYKVWCARFVSFDGKEVIFVPIINLPHADNQFGVPQEHYHIDGRFVTKNIGKLFGDPKCTGISNQIIDINDKNLYYFLFSNVQLVKKKCLRSNTGIRPPNYAHKYWEWYKTQVGKKVNNKKCPHLGVMMLEKEDVYVCPLHGLHACKTTNRIIERTRENV